MAITRDQTAFITTSLAMNQVDSGAIVVVRGYALGAIYRIKDNQEIVLGRDPYRCDITIKGEKVSRYHVSICYRPRLNAYEVVDHSKNGCFLEGKERLLCNHRYQVPHGAKICLGDEDNIIQLG